RDRDDDDDRAVPEVSAVVRPGPGIREFLPVRGRRHTVRVLEYLARRAKRHHRDPYERPAGDYCVDRDEQYKRHAPQLPDPPSQRHRHQNSSLSRWRSSRDMIATKSRMMMNHSTAIADG